MRYWEVKKPHRFFEYDVFLTKEEAEEHIEKTKDKYINEVIPKPVRTCKSTFVNSPPHYVYTLHF